MILEIIIIFSNTHEIIDMRMMLTKSKKFDGRHSQFTTLAIL